MRKNSGPRFPFGRAECDFGSPEARLMMAVLIDAYRAISQVKVSSRSKGRRRGLAAAFWLANDENWGPFSFVNICNSIGLDIAAARDPAVLDLYIEQSKIEQASQKKVKKEDFKWSRFGSGRLKKRHGFDGKNPGRFRFRTKPQGAKA